MADTDLADTQSALFREYLTKPFYRRACVITFDDTTPDKYRLSQVDPGVCDTGFMSVIARGMASPQYARFSVSDKSGTGFGISTIPSKIGTVEHFELAVERIPHCVHVDPSRVVI